MVRLIAREGKLRLSIKDDGVGFDLVVVGGKGRLGLVSMESAHLLNAGLQIESKPDHGPQIEATVRIG